MRRYLILSTIFVGILSFIFLLTRKEQEFFLPEERDITNYLHQTGSRVPELVEILAHIDSSDKATESVYVIAEIVKFNQQAYDGMVFSMKNKEVLADFVEYAMKAECTETRKSTYQTLLHEYTRLKSNDFYGSQSLASLLNSYFIICDDESSFFAWLPTTRMRLAKCLDASYAKIWSKERIKEELTKDSIEIALSYRGNIHVDNVTLLMLDALYLSGNRASSNEAYLISPPYPILRGDSEIFQNCFCSKYCFQPKYSVGRSSPEKELWNSPLSYIQSLNPIKASQSSYFSKSWTDVYGTCIVFDLSSPFRSKYLILHFKPGENHPYSFEFTDTLAK